MLTFEGAWIEMMLKGIMKTHFCQVLSNLIDKKLPSLYCNVSFMAGLVSLSFGPTASYGRHFC